MITTSGKFSAKLYPRRRSEEACRESRCVYSVSLCTAVHDSVIEGYRWATDQFNDVMVYLGDGPLLETTLQVLGEPSLEAPRRARAIADAALVDLNSVRPVTSLTSASSLAVNTDFLRKLSDVRKASLKDDCLGFLAEKDARNYVDRMGQRGRLGMALEDAVLLSRDYILFEVAAYAYMAKLGYSVDIYCGDELTVLKQFMQGRVPGFPELTNRVFISLRPEI